jgi:hypothetical protein
MKNVHLVIADLFLPEEFSGEVCAQLRLPVLEKILARGVSTNDDTGSSFEDVLCGLFDVSGGSPVAPISAAFDGLDAGCWLRADPVHVRLQREQVVLLPVVVSVEESEQLCASLNAHFSAQGLTFFAPHPARWYLRVAKLPDMITVPLSQVAGRNIHGNLPTGSDARYWHQLFNEIQMLLFAHPLNELREARGEMPVNSVWFWGGGCEVAATAHYDSTSSDAVLPEMLAAAAKIPFSSWQPVWCSHEGQLLVWNGLRSAIQRGDLLAWRQALQDFEAGYLHPLWHALRSGQITQLQVDVIGSEGMQQIKLARGDSWAFWRRSKPLADYSLQTR